MSHVATVEIEIKDLDALEAACLELGLELVRGQKSYKWYGRWVNDYSAADAAYHAGIDPKDYGKCDHAIRVTGNSKAYEVGIIKKPNGQYGLIWDFFAGGHGLMEKVGNACGTLVKGYATQVAIKQARKQGFNVQRKQLADGRVQLVCQR